MIAFSKYHGCGNDFILMTESGAEGRSYSELAKRICHRTLGIGADGLIIVRKNPLEMVIYNSDGSQAPMCGNGIRCFAKYCYDESICNEDDFSVETLAGIMRVRVVEHEPYEVEINMGSPDFDPAKCGIQTKQTDFLKQKINLKDRSVEVSTCFMGTVHTVVWLDDLQIKSNEADMEKLGCEISNHPLFTEKTNVNMVRVIDRSTLELVTFERGAGMTYACGTGACASVVIGALEGRCERKADVLLPYGTLHIVQKTDNEVMMTGPAVKVGQGVFEE